MKKLTREEIEKLPPGRMIREYIGDMVYWHCPWCGNEISPFDTECKCGRKLIPDS